MEQSINITTTQFRGVTRSFTKKLNLKNVVPGHDYEMTDFFASHSEQIPLEEATAERVAEVSEKLYQAAKAEVEAAEAAYVRQIQIDAGIPVQPTGAEYTAIKDIITAFESAETKEQVDVAAKMVVDAKDTLSETQLQYLRDLRVRANGRVK